MKFYRLGILALIVVLATAVFVPVRPVAAQSTGLLTNISVTGILDSGDPFAGTLSITRFAQQNGQLLVSGTLTYVDATGATVTQTFSNVVASLTSGGASCDILFLDLGPLFLDLLGLQVDLSQITLDIDAVPGAGNLLGNLLCAVAGLLDTGGPLQAITQLLNQINRLL